MRLQQELARHVVAQGAPEVVQYVAGADLAFTAEGRARGAIAVMSYPDLQLRAQVVVEGEVSFPYIPGLLAFREVPVLTQAFLQLEVSPHLVLVDGHGLSHPRRFGIACHLGLMLQVPTIGCAKSRLCGYHGPVPQNAGGWTFLYDRGDKIGIALRTKEGAAPIYVSPGHLISLEEAGKWAFRLVRGHRLPEPLRIADLLSKGKRAHQPPYQAHLFSSL